MFIRMMTLIGTPISHKRTLRIFLNSVSLLGDKLAAHTRVPLNHSLAGAGAERSIGLD
jgi:hypothetical protein